MSKPNRPLSPHLQVYRPQLTSVLSITHRATGVGLVLGALFLVWWLFATSMGGSYFDYAQRVLGSWIGQLLLLGFSFALFYHLCNGIRHLFWDAGYGLELDAAYKSGWLTVVGSVALTALAWIIGLSAG